MAGYDLSGVVQNALMGNLFDAGESFSVVLDTGTSRTFTPNHGNFVEFSLSTGPSTVVKGIAEGQTIEGSGKVEYVVSLTDGSQTACLQLDAYYAPNLHPNLWLISPQGIYTMNGN